MKSLHQIEPLIIYGSCLGHKIPLQLQQKTVLRYSVPVDYPFFSQKCKEGCRNYNNKWCCPPNSPVFNKISVEQQFLHIILIYADLESIPSSRLFQRVKIANAIMTSKLRKLLTHFSSIPTITPFGSGSCKACRPCKIQVGLPCQKPDRKMFSFESVGINCQDLVKQNFDFTLEWYKPKQSLRHTAVVGGFLLDDKQPLEEHLIELPKVIEKLTF